jgi:Transglutaminase-like superfamily
VKVVAAMRRFAALSAAERGFAIRALGVVAWVRIRLTVSRFPAVDRLTNERPIRPAVGPHPPARIGSTVAAVSAFVPGASCLTQALATRVLLADEGHSSRLRLGMARIEGRLQAHAWLESEGAVVVGGAGHEQFAPFESAPSPNR